MLNDDICIHHKCLNQFFMMDGIWNANREVTPSLHGRAVLRLQNFALTLLRRSDAPLGRYAPRPHLRDVAITLLRRFDAPLGRYAPRIRTYATSR